MGVTVCVHVRTSLRGPEGEARECTWSVEEAPSGD